MAGEKLVHLIKNSTKAPSSESADLMFGIVTSVSPLKIKVDNRFEIDENFLILSALCKEKVISGQHLHALSQHNTQSEGDNSHSHIINQHDTQPGGSDSHVHAISQQNTGLVNEGTHSHAVSQMNTEFENISFTLWRGLIVGDTVRLIRLNKGQLFYVLERDGGLT